MLKIDRFISQIIGKNCLLCDSLISQSISNTQSDADEICSSCCRLLPKHNVLSCPICGLGNTNTICGQCLHAQPNFDKTYASFSYDYPIDHVLQHFKYRQQLSIASTLAHFMLQNQPHEHIDYLIPMPMHPERLKERGFNQSLEIAKILGKLTKIPVKLDACQRIIHTAPQASLALKERAKNIKGAFKAESALTGKHIALVDDVMTSGASLNELAKTLKQAGAAHVCNWIFARTLP